MKIWVVEGACTRTKAPQAGAAQTLASLNLHSELRARRRRLDLAEMALPIGFAIGAPAFLLPLWPLTFPESLCAKNWAWIVAVNDGCQQVAVDARKINLTNST